MKKDGLSHEEAGKCSPGTSCLRGSRFDSIAEDVAYGLRTLTRNLRFTALVAITLALGTGASTTVFSVLNTVLIQPLPYAESDRLVWLWSVRSENPLKQRVSFPDFVDWRAESTTLNLVGHGGLETVLTGTEVPERLRAELFVGDLFALLGVSPMLGSASADVRGEEAVVILSHELWRRRFNADPGIVGTPITLDGASYVVAAVMPSGFEFPVRASERVDLWMPVAQFNPVLARLRDARLIEVIGRLRRGATLEQAQAELDVIAANLSARYPETNRGFGVRLKPALEEVTGNVSRGLLLLGGAVGALLLIGCVNVANLLLARTMARGKEIATRAALGAPHARIARQLLIESLLLAGMGGVLGCLLAVWGVGTLSGLLADILPRGNEIAVNGHVLVIATALSLGTGLLFGLAPAWGGSRVTLIATLQQSTRTASQSASGKRLSDVLVVGEIALAMILLAGAVVFVHSFWKLNQADAGFDPRNVLTFEVSWPSSKYPRPEEAFRQLRTRLLEIPGVQESSVGLQLPDRGAALLDDTSPFVQIEGGAIAPAERPRVSTLTIEPGFFRTLGIPLVAGRDFSGADRSGGRPVVIVNEALVRGYVPGENALGRRVSLDSWVLRGESAAEIVGVVGDVRHRGLDTEVQPTVYLPLAQRPVWDSPMVVKTLGDPLALIPAVREAVRSIDPDQPIDNIDTLEQRIAHTLVEDRFRALLLGAFSVVAVILAGVGLYAVLSYATARRAREIGIRLALGARSGDVLKAVIGQGMKRVLAGVLLGLAGASVLIRLVDNLLFEVAATDPGALAVATVVLFLVGLLACSIPARRAMDADPAAIVRAE